MCALESFLRRCKYDGAYSPQRDHGVGGFQRGIYHRGRDKSRPYASLDILLLLFFLLHGLYGLRVILIDVGWLREDRFFWRTLGAALLIFNAAMLRILYLGCNCPLDLTANR